MVISIAFCIGIAFIILSIMSIYNQIKLIYEIELRKEVIMKPRKKFIVLDCVILTLSIIFFCIIYFIEVDGYILKDGNYMFTLLTICVLFLAIIFFSLFNIAFLINSKRKKSDKADKKMQLIAMFIIYCLIIFLMEMSSKYCKMITTLMWTNYFYGYVLMYMHFLVKICFYVALTPIVFFISKIVTKR